MSVYGWWAVCGVGFVVVWVAGYWLTGLVFDAVRLRVRALVRRRNARGVL